MSKIIPATVRRAHVAGDLVAESAPLPQFDPRTGRPIPQAVATPPADLKEQLAAMAQRNALITAKKGE